MTLQEGHGESSSLASQSTHLREVKRRHLLSCLAPDCGSHSRVLARKQLQSKTKLHEPLPFDRKLLLLRLLLQRIIWDSVFMTSASSLHCQYKSTIRNCVAAILSDVHGSLAAVETASLKLYWESSSVSQPGVAQRHVEDGVPSNELRRQGLRPTHFFTGADNVSKQMAWNAAVCKIVKVHLFVCRPYAIALGCLTPCVFHS